jgi:hypothetical protein
MSVITTAPARKSACNASCTRARLEKPCVASSCTAPANAEASCVRNAAAHIPDDLWKSSSRNVSPSRNWPETYHAPTSRLNLAKRLTKMRNLTAARRRARGAGTHRGKKCRRCVYTLLTGRPDCTRCQGRQRVGRTAVAAASLGSSVNALVPSQERAFAPGRHGYERAVDVPIWPTSLALPWSASCAAVDPARSGKWSVTLLHPVGRKKRCERRQLCEGGASRHCEQRKITGRPEHANVTDRPVGNVELTVRGRQRYCNAWLNSFGATTTITPRQWQAEPSSKCLALDCQSRIQSSCQIRKNQKNQKRQSTWPSRIHWSS